MKRFVILFLVVLVYSISLFNAQALADVMPYYTGSISNDTIGFLQVPKSFKLYLYPREDSQNIENVTWTDTEVKLNKKTIEPAALFAAQVQAKDLAFCMVVDMQDDWYQIIYDKDGNKKGWIKSTNIDNFWSLKDFYSYYGRKYGLYYMKNIDYRKRGYYSGADKLSQKLGGFTYIRSIKLSKISGNWALVTVLDMGGQLKIGYVQWREDDGSISLFPKLAN